VGETRLACERILFSMSSMFADVTPRLCSRRRSSSSSSMARREEEVAGPGDLRRLGSDRGEKKAIQFVRRNASKQSCDP